MAVPTLGAKIIFESNLKTFSGMEYDSIKPRWKIAIKEEKIRERKAIRIQ